jgi:hypothetical protein
MKLREGAEHEVRGTRWVARPTRGRGTATGPLDPLLLGARCNSSTVFDNKSALPLRIKRTRHWHDSNMRPQRGIADSFEAIALTTPPQCHAKSPNNIWYI